MLGNISHHVTFRCNLKCGMCLFHVLSQDDELVSQEVTTEEWIEYFDTLPQCREMTVSGGESFLREDLDQLVLAAIEKTNHLYLNTNGILTRKLEDLLLKLDAELLPKITVIISLDGATPETHDKIRGMRGAWAATTKSLQLLYDLDVARGATMVVQPDNYQEIHDVYQLGRTWNLNAGFQMVMPEADYTTSQMKEIHQQLKIVWEDIKDPGYEYYLRGSLYHQIYGKRLVPCYLENTCDIDSGLIRAPLIDPIGNVYPCGNAPWMKQRGYGYPELVMGNVQDTPLTDIIQSNRTREVLGRIDPENCDWCWSNCSIEPTFSHLKTLSEEEVMKIDRLNNAHQADV